jgi:hypothetical protein
MLLSDIYFAATVRLPLRKEPMPPTPANSFLLEGTVTVPPTSNLFMRLRRKGPLTQFVEFLGADIADPALGPFPPNSVATELVKIDSRLHFSDYPLPGPAPLPVGPIVPIHRGPVPSEGFFANDGTLLRVTRASNQITGFSAESKDGHKYDLSLETFSSPAADVPPNLKPWCAARMSLLDNGDDPLQFGFAYCPLEEQFDIFLERQNVSTGIAVNLQPLVLQPNGSILGSATLSRDLTYYKNSFGTQTLGMDSESTDPAMYLPISAAFWPYLKRVGFFAPALRALASQTADQVALPAKPPLHTLGSLQAYNTLQVFVANSISLVGPALGPFAASFIPPNDSGAAPWIDAARWLGWVLMHGTGSQNLTSAFTAQYQYLTSIVPPSVGGSPKIPIFKAPSANLTPASQINDLLGR